MLLENSLKIQTKPCFGKFTQDNYKRNLKSLFKNKVFNGLSKKKYVLNGSMYLFL